MVQIDEHGDGCCLGNELAQKFQPLRAECAEDEVHTRHIATGPVEACHKAEFDRVASTRKYDRNGLRHCLSRKARDAAAGRSNYRYAPADQFGRQCRQSLVMAVCPAVFGVTFRPSTYPSSLRPVRNAPTRYSDSAGERPLRNPITGIACCARARERPRSRRTAEQRDELAPLHSITSSARASSIARHFEAERPWRF